MPIDSDDLEGDPWGRREEAFEGAGVSRYLGNGGASLPSLIGRGSSSDSKIHILNPSYFIPTQE